jgi:competence protein ComGC
MKSICDYIDTFTTPEIIIILLIISIIMFSYRRES